MYRSPPVQMAKQEAFVQVIRRCNRMLSELAIFYVSRPPSCELERCHVSAVRFDCNVPFFSLFSFLIFLTLFSSALRLFFF